MTGRMVEYDLARGRSYLDLSVMHNNIQTVALYEKLGFERMLSFTLKRNNSFNEVRRHGRVVVKPADGEQGAGLPIQVC